MNTQSACNWTASVTSGSTWLSTSSSGTGSGAISITVLQNTSTSLRTGTIDVSGQTLTIIQPAANTGTNELKNNLFSIYPNPANDQITIEAKQEMMGKKYEIIDNLGRIIIEGKINNSSTTIQLENVAAGVYFFRVNEEGYNLKLIKN